MEYLNHHVKFQMWPALCKFPILFSAVKLKLGHNVSQFILDSKLGLLNLALRLYFQVFDNSQRNLKLRFLNVAPAGLPNFCQFMDVIENLDFGTLA